MPTALLMAARKNDQLVEFAKPLANMGWTLYGSKGTASYFNQHGVQATDMAILSGDPILDHRVVSLSREIHAGLLSLPQHKEEMERLGYPEIDLVFVDFYQTADVLAKHPDLVADYSVINEQIDIGGPTAIRSGIKGGRIVLTDLMIAKFVLGWLRDGCPNKRVTLANLWSKAEQDVADYCQSVAKFRREYYLRVPENS